MRTRKQVLRRYTDLPALLTILTSREITLLPPASWDDRNDRHLMDAYKRARSLKTLLALCFSATGETYHHWKVFAPGNAGICIEFDRDALLDSFPSRGFTHSEMDYKTLSELKTSKLNVRDLPFTKRAAFIDEKEYRVVFSSRTQTLDAKSVPIDLEVINRVAVNPWLPPALFKAIEKTVQAIGGCEELDIYHSKLIESPTWKRFAGDFAEHQD